MKTVARLLEMEDSAVIDHERIVSVILVTVMIQSRLCTGIENRLLDRMSIQYAHRLDYACTRELHLGSAPLRDISIPCTE